MSNKKPKMKKTKISAKKTLKTAVKKPASKTIKKKIKKPVKKTLRPVSKTTPKKLGPKLKRKKRQSPKCPLLNYKKQKTIGWQKKIKKAPSVILKK